MVFVSIIIPYYKKRKYIFKALKSLDKQTFKNYEVIIVYNDKVLSDYHYLKKKLKKKKNFSLVIKNNKSSAGFARNYGIKISKGKFIAFLDADDFWYPDKLKKQINFMVSKNYSFTHTSYYILGKNKKKMIASNLDYNQILKSCDVGLSTVVVEKKILPKKPFPDLKTKEDYVLWLSLLKKNKKIYALKSILASWRETENSLSSNLFQKIMDAFRVYYKYCNYSFLTTFYFVLRLSFNSVIKKI